MTMNRFLIFILSLVFLSSCRPASSPDFFSQDSENLGIIGGEKASAQDFPYIVNIWLNSPEDSFVGHLCGASLIDAKWVLTAAHCVLQDVTDKSAGVVKLKEVTLYLGSLQPNGKGGHALTAKSIRVHPNFSWPKFDVALIELNESVSDIAPVRLNQKAFTDFSGNLQAQAAGWGLIDALGKTEAEFLQKITLPLVSREICNADPYVKGKSWLIESDMICAKTAKGQKATCGGDSGGPLVQKQNGQDVQIGIVSWGTACRVAYQDKQSDIEGYADVSAAFAWIQKQIAP